MSLQVGLYEGSPEAWDRFVEAHGWVYHSHTFGDVIRRGLRQSVVRIQASSNGELRGVLSLALIKSRVFGAFGVSLPVSDHSGICASTPEAARAIAGFLDEFRKAQGLDYVELRHFESGSLELPETDRKVTMMLPLPSDAEDLWKQVGAKVRNLVRKGERSELVHSSGSVELLDEFYALYAENLRDLGTPCYPRALFSTLLETFPQKARLHLLRVGEKGAAVATGLALAHGSRLQIPFAASPRRFRNMSPMMLLYWRILAGAVEGGFGEFDFGRSTRESGTYRFKKQWGAQEHPLHWAYVLPAGGVVPEVSVENARYQAAISLWRKLPVGVTRWLGPKVVRLLP